LLAVVTCEASAFDGKRKGFLLGLGAGLGRSSIGASTSIENVSVSASSAENNFATNFQIGAGLSEQAAVYWVSRVAWGSDEIESYAVDPFGNVVAYDSQDVLYTNGFGGIGGAYFLSPSESSVFFSGALGFTSLSYPTEPDLDSEYGFGFMVGTGFEFARHVAMEVTYSRGGLGGDDLPPGVDVHASNLLVTINWLGY
jgi:hypothetical protein